MKYIFNNFLNTLRQYRMAGLLNVVGMAVAFATFHVIMTQVVYDFGYNRQLRDCKRTFLVTVPSNYESGKYNAWICRPLGEALVDGAPEVECGGMMQAWAGEPQTCWMRKDGAVKKLHLSPMEYSAGGLRVLNYEAAEGSLDALSRPGTLAVSQSYARKNGISVGDMISWRDPEGEKGAEEVVAIFRDFQSNSDLGTVNAVYDAGENSISDPSEWAYQYVVKLHDAAQKESFENSSASVVREFVQRLYGVDGPVTEEEESEFNEVLGRLRIKLISFRELYYTKALDGKPGKSGNLTTDLSMLAVAVLIILIALINFINFFFALVPSRLKTVNTYKVFGVSRNTLILNFIGESVGLVAISLALAALLVQAFSASPLAGSLSAPAGLSGNAGVLALTAGVALTAAVLGSIHPAIYITSFQPAMVLKGSFGGSTSGRRLRNVLIGFQFAISIALIICAWTISLQHSWMMHRDMGFDKSNLLSGKIPFGLCWYGEQNRSFEDRLRSNPQIRDITWADGRIVNTSRMGWGREYKGRNINFQCYPVAWNFLEFMGIEITQGRNFTSSDEVSDVSSMIFNERGRRELDIDLETPGPGHGEKASVVGFCKDFNFMPLQYGGAPFAFYVFGKEHRWRSGLQRVYIRTAPGADPGEVIRFVNSTIVEMRPDADPELFGVDFFDKELGAQYRREEQLAQMIGMFTLIAIIISLMGVFGIVLFETQHRGREIAVRRVHGASVTDILKMFNRKFIGIVLASFAVAAPVSWLIVRKYLDGFAYSMPVRWWVFAVALAAVLLLTVTIVTLRSWKAATSNPVEQLKND